MCLSLGEVVLFPSEKFKCDKGDPGSMQDLIIEAKEPEVLVDYKPLKDTNTIASTSILTVSISLILSN